MIKELGSIDEYKNKPSNVLVKLGAPWCVPCKTLDRVLEEVSGESDIAILKVNIDNFPEIAADFGVMSVPTMLLFINGKPVWRAIGVKEKEIILEEIKKGRE